MPLDIQDFVAQADGVRLEDVPPVVQERLNEALSNLTGGAGGPTGPVGELADLIVSAEQGVDDGTSPFATIGAAVTASSSGDVVFVEPGTYDESVLVDTPDLSIVGTTDPTGDEPATVDGTLQVSASGVTVDGLRFSPSTKYEYGGLDPNVLLVTSDDVTVKNNLLEGLQADNTNTPDGKSPVTLNGIQVFDASDSPIGGVKILDNTVRNVVNDGDASAGWPHYGGAAAIKIQGTLNGVEVVGNTVEDIYSAGWTWGIVMTHTTTADYDNVSPRNVSVEKNTVKRLNTAGSRFKPLNNGASSAPYPGSAFGIDGNSDANEATVTNNNFVDVPHGVQSKDPDNTLDVRNNWWGAPDGPSTGFVPTGVSSPISDTSTGELADGSGTGISVTKSGVEIRFDPWLNSSV